MDLISRDKLKGMLAGHFMGDALGAPYEFYKWNRDRVYTGKLNIDLYRRSTMYGRDKEIRHPKGSVTDDTQMTIALIRSLIEEDKWDKESVVLSYCKWSHTPNTGMGLNTQFLFANKTYKGYESRVAKMQELIKSGEKGESLSNGCLMRCSPLAIFATDKQIVKDTKLTNPYSQNIQVNKLYYSILRLLLLGGTNVREIIIDSLEWITDKNLIKCIKQGLNKEQREVGGKDKGWVLHAFWCSIIGILMCTEDRRSYRSIIKWVITQGTKNGVGDTDTNAAITGALVGAAIGWDKLMSTNRNKKNWKVLESAAKNVDSDLRFFLPTNIDKLVDELMKLVE